MTPRPRPYFPFGCGTAFMIVLIVVGLEFALGVV